MRGIVYDEIMEIAMEQLYGRLGVSPEELQYFCASLPILELAFFGSVLRKDFCSNSDVDVLIALTPNHEMGLFEFFDLEEQFQTLFKRDVDLIERAVIEKDHNWIRRREILNNNQIVYESRQILSA